MSTPKITLTARQIEILRWAPSDYTQPKMATRIREIRILAGFKLLTVPQIHFWGHSYQITREGRAAVCAHAPAGCRGAA